MSRTKPKPAPPDLYYNVLCTGGCGNKLHRFQSHTMHRGDGRETLGRNEQSILGGVCDACMLIVNLFASAGVFVEEPWLTSAAKLAKFELPLRREAEAAVRLGARGDEVLAILRSGR